MCWCACTENLTMSGAWGTQAVERAPIEEIPLINEVHIDGLVRARIGVAFITQPTAREGLGS